MNETLEILADRLDNEPVIFRGANNRELIVIVVMASVFWIPVSLILTGWAGSLSLSLVFISLGMMSSIFIGSTVLQKIKRGRPDNHYFHAIITWLDDQRLRKSGLIRGQGYWDLGR